jgi:hypothetical protein
MNDDRMHSRHQQSQADVRICRGERGRGGLYVLLLVIADFALVDAALTPPHKAVLHVCGYDVTCIRSTDDRSAPLDAVGTC